MSRTKSQIIEARNQVIKLMYDEGIKYKEIAAVINQTTGYVCSNVKKMRIEGVIKSTRYSSDNVQVNQCRHTEGYDRYDNQRIIAARQLRNQILTLYWNEVSYREIAEKLDVNINTLLGHINSLRKHGLIPGGYRNVYRANLPVHMYRANKNKSM